MGIGIVFFSEGDSVYHSEFYGSRGAISERMTYVFMDEFGDTGDKPMEVRKGIFNPSKVFGFGCTVTGDPERLGRVSQEIRDAKGISKEVKARKLDYREKVEMSRCLVMTATVSYALGFDKNMATQSVTWMSYDGVHRQVMMLVRTLDMVLSQRSGSFYHVVFDDHNSYKPSVARTALDDGFEWLSERHGVDLTCESARSSSGEFKDQLQSNDIVPHSMILQLEREEPSISGILGVRQRLLGKTCVQGRMPPQIHTT